jgi:hypothetical protein
MELFVEKEGVEYKYSCLLFNLPKATSNLIIAYGKKHIPDDVLYDDEDKDKGRENSPHNTVKYGLTTKKVEDIKEITDLFSQFSIKLGKISKFKADKYDVIKIEIEDDKELRKLNKVISDTLDHRDTHKIYNPHITIAYVIPGSCDKLLNKRIFKNLTLGVKELTLSIRGTTEKVKIPLKKDKDA